MIATTSHRAVVALRYAASASEQKIAATPSRMVSSPVASSSRLSLATPIAAPPSRPFVSIPTRSTLTSAGRQTTLRQQKLASLPRLTPPSHRTLATHAPTLTSKPENPEEPNVYKKGDPTILLTERAVKQLLKIALKDKDKAARLGLRIAVEPGGCHGYQYKMELEEGEEGQDGPGEEDDFRFQATQESGEIPPLPILIDSISLTLLQGSTIDYVTELIGSQFAIKDNPQAKGAGCGCGVSWEPIV
ncbi:hypothetical protein BCV69DRAFT_282867 [Microstroma glucosiphilum]|uniref:Core domain-containing protein n=1 Tax=Pseudomicrostroma glucosiphilum TaxID=1684307 RepID=A0A316U5V6_9BASI|nr:hypothetical protein BCV69DRAFT_282867 [Pseudomicrostroma glucosiphilum]PWN20647.1 hypothetical protein BCV69DRAFT_282867 [Pseudomicrostroma glucosiphilum]